jgi:hypothetical protein
MPTTATAPRQLGLRVLHSLEARRTVWASIEAAAGPALTAEELQEIGHALMRASQVDTAAKPGAPKLVECCALTPQLLEILGVPKAQQRLVVALRLPSAVWKVFAEKGELPAINLPMAKAPAAPVQAVQKAARPAPLNFTEALARRTVSKAAQAARPAPRTVPTPKPAEPPQRRVSALVQHAWDVAAAEDARRAAQGIGPIPPARATPTPSSPLVAAAQAAAAAREAQLRQQGTPRRAIASRLA